MSDISCNLLIIDDDFAVQQLLHRYLSHQKYHVQTAGTGADALSILEVFQPDLVILDINLPDMNGLSLLQKIQRYTAPMILILTSLTTQDDKIRSFSQGADDFLLKPFDLEELRLRVVTSLNSLHP